MLYGARSLGFEMKLNFALALGLISAEAKAKLMKLNTIRNKCSHNWLLKVRQRQKRRPIQKKPPLLLYEGRDLHGVQALKDFIKEFGAFYAGRGILSKYRLNVEAITFLPVLFIQPNPHFPLLALLPPQQSNLSRH
jgi:hypothetical protein